MLRLLACLLLVACSQAVNNGRDLSDEVCQTLSAQSAQHGSPLEVELDLLSFEVTGGGDDGSEDFHMRLEIDNQFSILGLAMQVREYGVSQLNNTMPLGVFIEPDQDFDLWLCPFTEDGTQSALNGVVHRNQFVQVQEVHVHWQVAAGRDPQCVRVLATVMAPNGAWWHAIESQCFLHVVDGVRVECPIECFL